MQGKRRNTAESHRMQEVLGATGASKIVRVAREPGDLLEPDPLNVGLSRRFSKLETVGLDRVNGKPCFRVNQWLEPGNTVVTVCYDRETYLPLRLAWTSEGVPQTMTLGDYRKVGPLTVPFLLEMGVRGQTIRVQMEKITINEPLPPEALELPEEIEQLAYQRLPNEIREVEVDKDRPILRHRPAPAKSGAKKQ